MKEHLAPTLLLFYGICSAETKTHGSPLFINYSKLNRHFIPLRVVTFRRIVIKQLLNALRLSTRTLKPPSSTSTQQPNMVNRHSL